MGVDQDIFCISINFSNNNEKEIMKSSYLELTDVRGVKNFLEQSNICLFSGSPGFLYPRSNAKKKENGKWILHREQSELQCI